MPVPKTRRVRGRPPKPGALDGPLPSSAGHKHIQHPADTNNVCGSHDADVASTNAPANVWPNPVPVTMPICRSTKGIGSGCLTPANRLVQRRQEPTHLAMGKERQRQKEHVDPIGVTNESVMPPDFGGPTTTRRPTSPRQDRMRPKGWCPWPPPRRQGLEQIRQAVWLGSHPQAWMSPPPRQAGHAPGFPTTQKAPPPRPRPHP